jgi:hypothetical protein
MVIMLVSGSLIAGLPPQSKCGFRFVVSIGFLIVVALDTKGFHVWWYQCRLVFLLFGSFVFVVALLDCQAQCFVVVSPRRLLHCQ